MVERPSVGYRVFQVFNYMFLTFLGLVCILPMINVLALSFSNSAAIEANLVTFWPVNFNIQAYIEIFNNARFFEAFKISIMRSVAGLVVNMVMIFLTAYPLSFEPAKFRGRTVIMWYFVVTMLISGGLVPTYLLIRNLKLIDNFFVLVLPGALPVFSMILMMNYFRNLPSSLYEAALIDGAGHMSILIRLYIPLSIPSVATLMLFSAVGHWNSWFDAFIYMNNDKNWPLQTLLQSIITSQPDISKLIQEGGIEKLLKLSERSLTAAKILVSTVPILIVYPSVQKYFIKGIMLGSVKG
jgi:putative aldouronate transport system permease protein